MSTLTRLRASGKAALGATTSALLLAGGLLAVPAVAHAADEAPEEGTVTEATLDWGVKTSFRNYIQGPIANGSVAVRGNTVDEGDSYTWSGGVGEATTDGSTVDVSFGAGNGVHFMGHEMTVETIEGGTGSALDMMFTNPRIEISDGAGTLYLDVKSREYVDTTTLGPFFDETNVPVASLNLNAPVVGEDVLTWNDVPASLTEVGAEAFGGFYNPGDALDPVSFSLPLTTTEEEPEPVADPKITVTPAEDLDPTIANTLTVKGTGYVGEDAAFGAYVLFGTEDIWSGDGPLVADGWIDQQHISASNIVDGEFTTEIEIPADTLERDETYQVATSAAHHLSIDRRSLDAFAPVTVLQEEEPEPVADPKITVTPAENLDPAEENVLQIEGTGFVGDGAQFGAYVLFGEKAVWSGGEALPADGWIAQGWVPAAQITDGAFSTTLTVPADALDPEKEYHVATSAAHGLSATDRSLDAFAPVTVLQEEEPEAPEETEPAVDIEGLEKGEVRQGADLTFVGSGFTKGDLVTVTVNSEPVVVAEDVEADDNGEVSVPWTVPADFALGAHTVVLALNGEDVAEAGFSVIEAVATDGNTGAEGEGNTNAETTVDGEGQDGDKLANTGAEATAVFVLAGLSLLVGTGAMLSRMRKAKLDI